VSSRCAALVLGILFSTLQAFAQESRTEQIEKEKSAKAASLQPGQRETGDVWVTRFENLFMPEPPAWRLTLGDFRPGAGLAAGGAYAMPAMGSGLWTAGGAWSINNFKQAGSALQFPPAIAGRLNINANVNWNDAPDLTFFGLGNTSSRSNEVRYGLRTTEAGVGADLNGGHTARWFRFGAGVGYLSAHSDAGEGADRPIGAVFTSQTVPGLGTAPGWVHSSAYAGIDTRESPGYTRRGGLYRLTFHRYEDPDRRFSFDRTEIDLRQFVPVFHDNWVIALQGLGEITSSAPSQEIPYFLLPSLGGRDTLPGYVRYRFTDKDSMLLRSELRWTASPMVDMAAFLDQGMVAPRLPALDLQGLHRDVGIGVRFHGSTFTALRLEIVRSAEGWRYNVATAISF